MTSVLFGRYLGKNARRTTRIDITQNLELPAILPGSDVAFVLCPTVMTGEVSPKKDREDMWEWYTKDADRPTLPLTADLVRLLVEHQMAQPEGNPYVLVPTARYELIQELRRSGQWTVERGRSPLSKFCHRFNKIRARPGIEFGTFHDLRRTCLRNWIVRGLSLQEVRELAGHAGIDTTDRFYLAVRKDVVDRARAASAASRKGESVARLLLAPCESDKIGKPPCVSALRVESQKATSEECVQVGKVQPVR